MTTLITIYLASALLMLAAMHSATRATEEKTMDRTAYDFDGEGRAILVELHVFTLVRGTKRMPVSARSLEEARWLAAEKRFAGPYDRILVGKHEHV